MSAAGRLLSINHSPLTSQVQSQLGRPKDTIEKRDITGIQKDTRIQNKPTNPEATNTH